MEQVDSHNPDADDGPHRLWGALDRLKPAWAAPQPRGAVDFGAPGRPHRTPATPRAYATKRAEIWGFMKDG